MASVLRFRSDGRAVPSGNAGIDWSHPLAQGLVYLRLFNGSPGPIHNAQGTDAGAYSNAAIGMGDEGPAFNIVSAGSSSYFGIAGSANVKFSPPLVGTFVCQTRATFSPTDGAWHQLFSSTSVAGGNYPTGPDFSVQKNSNNNFYFGWYTGSDTRATAAASGTYTAGETFSVACTWDSTGTTGYIKGISFNKNTNNPSAASTAGDTFLIGTQESAADLRSWCQAAGDKIYYVAFWNRVLTASELIFLNSSPYCFMLSDELPILQAPAAAPSTIKFRRTFSQLGTRMGSRQVAA